MSSGKVANILTQTWDQHSTLDLLQVKPVKEHSNFPDTHPFKVFCYMLLMRIDEDIDTHLSNKKFKFRKNRGAVDAIFIVRPIKNNELFILSGDGHLERC